MRLSASHAHMPPHPYSDTHHLALRNGDGSMKGPLRFLEFLIYTGSRKARNPHPSDFSLGERPAPDSGSPDQREGGQAPSSVLGDISPCLDDSVAKVREVFTLPDNGDIVLREFTVASDPPVRAAVVYVEGLVMSAMMNEFVLNALMVTGSLVSDPGKDMLQLIQARLLPNNQVSTHRCWAEVMTPLLMGMVLLLVDGLDVGILAESKGWEHRTVGVPLTEQVVRGPQEGFNESLRVNTALLRRRLRTPKLIMEHKFVGRLSQTSIAICYVQGIAAPKLVDEVKRRLGSLDVDYVPDSGYIEQYIEDRPASLFPQTATTERPDRVAACLAEGNVALIVDGSPFVITLPAIFTSFFQSPEDYYLRWPYGLTLRLVRIVALFLALFLPGVWLALITFHAQMIPTPLLYSIAGTREALPFTLMVEVLLMEAGFELIREAGIRIPTLIGSTIGIVGALILGQAAVAASIVSPSLIIVVALTALGSFAVPSFAASFALRILRFPIIVLAGTLGFFGVAAGAFALVIHVVSLRSFGAPYLSTIAPARPSSDVAIMGPLYSMEKRPLFLHPGDVYRQPKRVRRWDEGGDGS